jgi:hypothetical protein
MFVAVEILFLVAILKYMGRSWGRPGLWAGSNEPNTSQHVADPYSFTHVLHGLLLYWALSASPWSFGTKLAIAVAVEVVWEISENTQAVIDKYRTQTVSLGYTGDSVLNSVADVGCMILGFALASVLPWQVSTAAVILTEMALLFAIRDNLTLNVVQLVAPSEKIKKWQSAGI